MDNHTGRYTIFNTWSGTNRLKIHQAGLKSYAQWHSIAQQDAVLSLQSSRWRQSSCKLVCKSLLAQEKKKCVTDTVQNKCLAFCLLINMSQNTSDKDDQSPSKQKNISLPISRVRLIMKSSPDVSNINQEALFLTTKATVSHSLVLNPLFHCAMLTRGFSRKQEISL